MKYQPGHLPPQHSATGLYMLDTVWAWVLSEAAASGREDSSFTHSRFVWLTELFYFRVRHSLWEHFLLRFYSLEETEHIGPQDCWEVIFETGILIGIFHTTVCFGMKTHFSFTQAADCVGSHSKYREKREISKTTHQDSKKHLEIS